VHRAEAVVTVLRQHSHATERVVRECRLAEKPLQEWAEDRDRMAGMRNLPAHYHHEDEPKEQEREAREPIL
jgi:hypothetical protein